MIRFLDVDQGTDTWMANRLGRATASNFGTIMANEGKAFGDPAKNYAVKIAIEAEIHRSLDTYQNEWMTRGIELEPIARELYEAERIVKVENGGLFISDCGRFSASPDGIVENGGIEIKSVKWSTHFDRLRMGGYDTSYRWQICGEMWLCELDWVDFISYCPDVPENKQLYIFRVERNEDEITRLVNRLNDFWELVENAKQILR